MVPFLQGQEAESNLSKAYLEGLDLRERLALKKAAGKLGAQNYFAGYEGVPGAERPAALLEGWQTASPEAMAKLEELYATPFKQDRQAELAGKTETARETARLSVQEPFFARQRARMAGLIPQNAMTSRLTGETSSSPAVEEPAQTAGMGEDLTGQSGIQETMGFGPQGIDWHLTGKSQLEQQQMRDDIIAKREATKQAKLNYQQKGIQEATQNLQQTDAAIRATNEGIAKHLFEPASEGPRQLQLLHQKLLQQQRDLSAAMQHETAPVTPEMPIPATEPNPELAGYDPQGELTRLPAAPSRRMPSQAQAPAPHQAPAPQPSPSMTAGMTDLDTSEINKAGLLAKMKDARDFTNLSIKDAQTAQRVKPLLKELHSLVMTDDRGYPSLEGIWGASNVLSLSPANARIKNLNDAIMSALVKEGQSGLNNTVVEKLMSGAQVPGLFSDAQLNRIKSSVLMSAGEHALKAPGFLEAWAKAHNGTLEGAQTMWDDYIEHNQRYTWDKSASGVVTGNTRTNLMEPKEWVALREQNRLKVVPPLANGGTPEIYVRQPNGKLLQR